MELGKKSCGDRLEKLVTYLGVKFEQTKERKCTGI